MTSICSENWNSITITLQLVQDMDVYVVYDTAIIV